MNYTDKHSDNISGEADALRPRRGRPKGLPKPPGSGRQKGTPNRVTRDVREAAQRHGPKALRKLVTLMTDPDGRVALAATREILDRAYGKPVTPAEITGRDGAPLMGAGKDISMLEAAQRIAFVLARGAKVAEASSSLNVPARRTDAPARVLDDARRDVALENEPMAETAPVPADADVEPDTEPVASRWQQQEENRPGERAVTPPAPTVVRFRPRRS